MLLLALFTTYTVSAQDEITGLVFLNADGGQVVVSTLEIENANSYGTYLFPEGMVFPFTGDEIEPEFYGFQYGYESDAYVVPLEEDESVSAASMTYENNINAWMEDEDPNPDDNFKAPSMTVIKQSSEQYASWTVNFKISPMPVKFEVACERAEKQYNGQLQSVNGYTVTVKDSEGNEVTEEFFKSNLVVISEMEDPETGENLPVYERGLYYQPMAGHVSTGSASRRDVGTTEFVLQPSCFTLEARNFEMNNIIIEVSGEDAGGFEFAPSRRGETVDGDGDGDGEGDGEGNNEPEPLVAGDVTVIPGYITVIPVELTITTNSHEWTFDGDAHSDPDYVITGGTLVEDEMLVPTFDEGSVITNVAESPVKNKATFVVKRPATLTGGGESSGDEAPTRRGETVDNGEYNGNDDDDPIAMELSENEDGESNYAITVVEGDLEVSPATGLITVTITGHTNGGVYCGDEYEAIGYEVDYNIPEAYQNLYQRSFKFTPSEGMDVVTPEDLLPPTPPSIIHLQDGNVIDLSQFITAITINEGEIGQGEIADDEGEGNEEGDDDEDVYIPRAARTEVGTTYMGMTAANFTNLDLNFSNVVFEVTDGSVTVTPSKFTAIVVGHHLDGVVYDGFVHTITGYDMYAMFDESQFNENDDDQILRELRNLGTIKVLDKLIGIDKVSFTDEIPEGFEDVIIPEIVPYYGTPVGEHYVLGRDFTGPTQEQAIIQSKDRGISYMKLKAEMFTNINPNYEVEFKVIDGYIEIVERGVALTEAGVTEENNIINDVIGQNNGIADVTLAGRTLYKDGGWNTICLPFDVDIESSPLVGGDARELNDAAFVDGTLSLNFTEEGVVKTLKAGVPYIIKWAEGEDLTDVVFEGAKFSAELQDKTIDLGDGKSVTFKGTYSKVEFAEDNKNVLLVGGAKKDEETGEVTTSLYYPQAGAYLNAQRAYFQLEGIYAGEKSAEAAPAFVLTFGDATVINGISVENASNEYFDLSGRRVAEPTTGIYIVNGKKVIVK